MDAATAGDQWITIPSWDRHQHYKDRDAPWNKLYLELQDKPEWVELPWSHRGMLVTLWIAFARSNGQLRVKHVARLCQARVRLEHLEALNHAGFIELSASKPLALRARPDRGREREALRASLSKERERANASAPMARVRALEETETAPTAPSEPFEHTYSTEPPGGYPSESQQVRREYVADDVERDPDALDHIRQLTAHLAAMRAGSVRAIDANDTENPHE